MDELVVGLVVVGIIAIAASLPAQVVEERPIVRSVDFEGNHAISDQQLRISISTSRSSAFQRHWYLRWVGFLGEKRYLNQTEFRRDVLRVRALYLQSGFMEATVDTVVRRGENDVYITFIVDEGEPVLITELVIEGLSGVEIGGNIESALPLRVGDPFNRRLLRASLDTLRTRLADRGHPFAEVFTRFQEDRAARVATVTFDVDPGVPVRVGRIEVEGADEVEESVVRRQIPIQVGQTFSGRRLYESQIDLYRFGVYNHVSVALVDSTPPLDSLVTVGVRVSEGPLRRVRLGVGWATDDCFRGSAQWTVNNVMGGGRRLLLNARVSRIGVGGLAHFENRPVCLRLRDEPDVLLTTNYNLSASLLQPFFFSRKTSATGSVFGERQSEFHAYRRDALGGDVGFTRQLTSVVPLTLSYSLVTGRTIGASAAQQCAFLLVCSKADLIFNETRLTSKITARLLWDRRGSLTNPTTGSTLVTEVAWSDEAIGSDSLSQFLKGVVEFASFHRVGFDRVLAWRVRVGTMLVPELIFAADTARAAPPEARFYAGGSTTVRGFGQNELGPVVYVRSGADTISAALGGNGVFIANVEYRFPIFGQASRVTGVAFLDVGRVFDDSTDVFDLEEIRLTPGLGLRISSPLGPVRVDLAYNPHGPEKGKLFVDTGTELILDNPDFTPSEGFLGPFLLHLSIGQAF